MAHPELISMVASALGAPNGKAPVAKVPAEETETEGDTASVPVPSDGDALSDKRAPTELMATLAPLLSGLTGGRDGRRGEPDDPRSCLLRALKPYVSRGRQEAIDSMIRISQISDLLKHLS